MSKLALELIEKEGREQSGYLDLGKTGLTPDNPDLQKVWDALRELTHLETLILGNENVDWNKLIYVDCKNFGEENLLKTIPLNINFLSNLKCLSIINRESQGLQKIENIEGLINLKTLELPFNNIRKLESFQNLINLEKLLLEGNQIQKLSNLDKLNKLQWVFLSLNNIQKLDNLENLTSLRHFYINGNQIQKLENIKSLTSLKHFNINNNQIERLENLENLKNLQQFDISSNQIERLENLENLKNLQQFDISSNQIERLENLENLKNLQQFNINNNQIKRLENLENLKNLQQFNINNNQIKRLENLENLKNLQLFDISSNQIQKLECLPPFKKLNKLNFSDTEVSDLIPLKSHILNGVQVNWSSYEDGICVQDCPLTIPPVEVVRQGPEAVRRYFEELEEEENIPLREAKLLIIGAGGVGKTSLNVKLQNPNNELPESEETTVGIKVTQTPKSYSIDEHKFTMHIWDFGGQDIYHPTHQLFLTKNSMYVLMQDGREQKTDFHYWLQAQELLADNSPLFIIQNLKDKSRCHIPMNELQSQFGNIKEYFEINLEEVKGGHEGYNKIVDFLKTTLKNLNHIGDVWPKTRYQIRDALKAKKADHTISLKEYRKLCDDLGYKEKVRQDDLLGQLHFLGTVLHFPEGNLKDLVITNPQWATDAIYAILDHTKKHYEKRGHFTWNDLEEVWKEDKYEGMYEKILRLMEKFELCFELPDQKDTYIAPLLLPEDRPDIQFEFKGSLQMQYEYDFMPKGILGRLIVRMHQYIKEHLFWKRGVALELAGTQALITEDYNSRHLSIAVQGSSAKELIFMISSEIDTINDTFHFSDRMRAVKGVPCNCSECEVADTPHFYEYDVVIGRIKRGKKKTIECPVSEEDVSLKGLLDNVSPVSSLKEIKSMISKGKVSIALKGLEGLISDGDDYNTYIALKQRYEECRKKEMRDIQEDDKAKQKIVNDLLEFIDMIEG